MSPANGLAHVTGNARKTDARGGDGVDVNILKNDQVLWSATIAFDDTSGYNFDLTVPMLAGDSLYFRIHQRSDPYYDSVYFNPTIAVEADQTVVPGWRTACDARVVENFAGVTAKYGQYMLHVPVPGDNQSKFIAGQTFRIPQEIRSFHCDAWLLPEDGNPQGFAGEIVLSLSSNLGTPISLPEKVLVISGRQEGYLALGYDRSIGDRGQDEIALLRDRPEAERVATVSVSAHGSKPAVLRVNSFENVTVRGFVASFEMLP